MTENLINIFDDCEKLVMEWRVWLRDHPKSETIMQHDTIKELVFELDILTNDMVTMMYEYDQTDRYNAPSALFDQYGLVREKYTNFFQLFTYLALSS